MEHVEDDLIEEWVQKDVDQLVLYYLIVKALVIDLQLWQGVIKDFITQKEFNKSKDAFSKAIFSQDPKFKLIGGAVFTPNQAAEATFKAHFARQLETIVKDTPRNEHHDNEARRAAALKVQGEEIAKGTLGPQLAHEKAQACKKKIEKLFGFKNQFFVQSVQNRR